MAEVEGEGQEEEEEEQVEQTSFWNFIPWINPDVRTKGKRGRKILISASDSIAAPAPAQVVIHT